MKVGLAMSTSIPTNLGVDASCVVGLPWSSDPTQPSFLDVVKGKLSNDLFTVDLRDKGIGMFNFGWIDDLAHTGSIAYAANKPNK